MSRFPKDSSREVWILGLMHSGTTVVWRAFRQDGRFLCFDEPLSGLGILPGQNSRNTYGEFNEILRENPREFWDKYAPLHPTEELNRQFTLEQERYISFLTDRAPYVVVDETHLHLHVHSLARMRQGAYVVHLYRRASGFVTSHLRTSIPTGAGVQRRIIDMARYIYNSSVFWSRKDLIRGLNRDLVIGNSADSKFGLLLAEAGYDSARIMSAPAVVRLLAYWHFHYYFIEREGPVAFGSRFRTVAYEDFAENPARVMNDIYEWIGLSPPIEPRYRDVHLPKPSFQRNDRRWRDGALMAGFDEQELQTLL